MNNGWMFVFGFIAGIWTAVGIMAVVLLSQAVEVQHKVDEANRE